MRAVQNPKVTEDRAFNGFGTNFEGSPEPIYGQLFLPRKFKVAVTGAWGLLTACWVVVGCLVGCPGVLGLACRQRCSAVFPCVHPAAILHHACCVASHVKS